MGFRKKWLDSRMPHLIGYAPPPLNKKLVGTYTGKKYTYYDEATHLRVITKSGGKPVLNGIGLAALGFAAFGYFTGVPLIAPIILVAIALCCITIGYRLPIKYYIFDRESGLFTYPDWLFRPSITVPILELEVYWQQAGGSSGAIRRELATLPPDSQGLTRANHLWAHPGDINEAWSFILWYMDRNRPLPPGDAFDEYRQRDFERRKAEGFPPPMFPSTFPTPEWTEEQNRERRWYWRDEDHYGRSESAWY